MSQSERRELNVAIQTLDLRTKPMAAWSTCASSPSRSGPPQRKHRHLLSPRDAGAARHVARRDRPSEGVHSGKVVLIPYTELGPSHHRLVKVEQPSHCQCSFSGKQKESRPLVYIVSVSLSNSCWPRNRSSPSSERPVLDAVMRLGITTIDVMEPSSLTSDLRTKLWLMA
jgi:hypothetical protein